MKRVIAISILAACLLGGNAAAADMSSLAYVNQVSTAAYSRLDTAAIVRPLIQVARDLPRVDSGNSSLALVWQKGDFNTSTIEQSGGRNVGLIRQIGYHNSAAIQQTGVGHQAMIFQQGRNNTAIIRQR